MLGDLPLNIEIAVEMWESPNNAGVVIDAVWCALQAGELLHEEPAGAVD